MTKRTITRPPDVPATATIEARCSDCGASFCPESEAPADLIHALAPDGKDCGGLGKIKGWWW